MAALDGQLLTAAKDGDLNTLHQLIKSGASVNCTGEYVSTKNHQKTSLVLVLVVYSDKTGSRITSEVGDLVIIL